MLKEIRNRRSIRQYSDREITKRQLTNLLKAAMRSPTAMNTQCWRFIAIRDRKVLKEIKDLAAYTKMLDKASAAIVILADTTLTHKEFCYTDTSAAAENILLEAVHEGFGGCWCAIAPSKERIDNYRKYFKLPKKMLPCCVISLGYPKEDREAEDRYDEGKITWVE